MNRKAEKILLNLYVTILIIMIIGGTFAFFTEIRVSRISPTIDSQTATTEFIVFDSGGEINIVASQLNLAQGMGNLSDENYASAYLRLSDDQTEVTHNYNLFLEIEKNNFVYSTASKTAELILSVTDPNGNPITEIEGLEYVTVGDVSGFDITTKSGRFYIAKNYEIKTNNEVLHMWNSKVTFINLDESQDENIKNKELKGHIKIEKVD